MLTEFIVRRYTTFPLLCLSFSLAEWLSGYRLLLKIQAFTIRLTSGTIVPRIGKLSSQSFSFAKLSFNGSKLSPVPEGFSLPSPRILK